MTGFLAGMDEYFLQVCRTDDQAMILIAIDTIDEIEPTGKAMFGKAPKPSVDPEGLKAIRQRCQHFVDVARAAVADAKKEDV